LNIFYFNHKELPRKEENTELKPLHPSSVVLSLPKGLVRLFVIPINLY